MITREQIEKRIADLQRQEKEVLNTLQAIAGAIQDSQYWLAQLENTDGALESPDNLG